MSTSVGRHCALCPRDISAPGSWRFLHVGPTLDTVVWACPSCVTIIAARPDWRRSLEGELEGVAVPEVERVAVSQGQADEHVHGVKRAPRFREHRPQAVRLDGGVAHIKPGFVGNHRPSRGWDVLANLIHGGVEVPAKLHDLLLNRRRSFGRVAAKTVGKLKALALVEQVDAHDPSPSVGAARDGQGVGAPEPTEGVARPDGASGVSS